MAQVNPIRRGPDSAVKASKLKERSLTRRERDQYRFITRALRNPSTQQSNDIQTAGLLASFSDQHFIQNCLVSPNRLR